MIFDYYYCIGLSVPCFFCLLYMRSQLLLLFSKGSLFLAPNSTTAENHHNRFISGFFAVGGAAWCLFVHLPFVGPEFFAAFTTFLDGCHSFCIVRLGLFPGAKNVVLRDEGVLGLTGL
jgi:hypothetical protein